MANKCLLFECEGCDAPIFEGDAYHDGEFPLCIACAPTYEDMLDNPGSFDDEDGNVMTFERAKKIASEHTLNGGNLSDLIIEDEE